MNESLAKSILFGVCVGDSVGLPVQFLERSQVKMKPVIDLIGYGTFNLPPGHWTDDSSLTFCLAEALIKDYDLYKISDNFIKWLFNGYWSSQEKAYDIGMSTYKAINKLKKGISPVLAGGIDENDNGNGSLMRILPLILYTKDLDIDKRFQCTSEVSSLTHRHIRSIIGCFYYLEFARLIIQGADKFIVYKELQHLLPNYLAGKEINLKEINLYYRLFKEEIYDLSEDEISSSGYIVDSLEASIWCLLTSNSYKETVLKAVNLGHDTDTIGAIAGGLAALIYGFNNIPQDWINIVIKKEKIFELAEKLDEKYMNDI